MTTTYYYAGIGARMTPPEVLGTMRWFSGMLADKGITLRSGGAKGADTAFEERSKKKQIFQPNGNYVTEDGEHEISEEISNQALAIAKRFHPLGDKLSPYVQALMTRNTYQLLGPDLNTHSSFVICWTPGGKVVGGTGQALRIAQSYDIPVYNFGNSVLWKNRNQLHIDLEHLITELEQET